MKRWFDTVMCRFFGRTCSTDRPASKDLIKEMKQKRRKVESDIFDLRRKRENIADTIGGMRK